MPGFRTPCCRTELGSFDRRSLNQQHNWLTADLVARKRDSLMRASTEPDHLDVLERERAS